MSEEKKPGLTLGEDDATPALQTRASCPACATEVAVSLPNRNKHTLKCPECGASFDVNAQ
jgi:transcription elongation factor Elf1